MNDIPDGGGGGSAGGPNERRLYTAVFTASTAQIDDAMSHLDRARTSLDVVTTQLGKLGPKLQEAWTSSDGQAAVTSTKSLSETLATKAQQLSNSQAALLTAKSA